MTDKSFSPLIPISGACYTSIRSKNHSRVRREDVTGKAKVRGGETKGMLDAVCIAGVMEKYLCLFI